MNVIPAIDLRQGNCVRLLHGEKAAETRYASDPEEVAAAWESEGASMLHVVDLDAAFGEPPQRGLVERIVRRVAIPVQVGGGVRTLEDFQRLRRAGASRVVFGTAAAKTPDVVSSALEEDAESVVVGIDVKNGEVAVRGWTEGSGDDPRSLGTKWASLGVRRFVYTEVSRDGAMNGLDLPSTASFARAVGGGVLASGGVGSLDHLEPLKAVTGIEGAIVGRALYERAFTLREALDLFQERSC